MRTKLVVSVVSMCDKKDDTLLDDVSDIGCVAG